MPEISKRILLQSISGKRALPSNYKETDERVFSEDKAYSYADVNLIEYKDVCITPQGIIFEGFHRYEQSFVWPYFKKEFNTFYLLKNFLRRKKITLPSSIVYICTFDLWTNGYYHWMSDFLPRLYIIKDLLKNKSHKLILPEVCAAPYMNATLQALGIEEENIVRLPQNSYFKIPHLLVPDRITPSKDHNPEIMKKLSHDLMTHYKIEGTAREKTYVSRAKANYRKIRNEDEILGLVKEFGYRIVYFEDYSLQDQIKLVADSKILLGAHGANLTNVLFMRPQTILAELRLSDYAINCFYSLADSVQVDYYYLINEELKTDHFSDLKVDVESFRRFLELLEKKLSEK